MSQSPNSEANAVYVVHLSCTPHVMYNVSEERSPKVRGVFLNYALCPHTKRSEWFRVSPLLLLMNYSAHLHDMRGIVWDIERPSSFTTLSCSSWPLNAMRPMPQVALQPSKQNEH